MYFIKDIEKYLKFFFFEFDFFFSLKKNLMVDTFILEVQNMAYWIRQEILQKIDITIGEIGLKY